MLQKAIEKLKLEMSNGIDIVKYIGSYLVHYVTEHPEIAEKILQEGKTIKGSYDSLYAVASKRTKVNNCVVISPDEGFKKILGYFGIDADSKGLGCCNSMPEAAKVPEKQAQGKRFDVSLEDLL